MKPFPLQDEKSKKQTKHWYIYKGNKTRKKYGEIYRLPQIRINIKTPYPSYDTRMW